MNPLLDLLEWLVGAIPDKPLWLRRLVIVLYVTLVGACIAGVAVVLVSALK